MTQSPLVWRGKGRSHRETWGGMTSDVVSTSTVVGGKRIQMGREADWPHSQ